MLIVVSTRSKLRKVFPRSEKRTWENNTDHRINTRHALFYFSCFFFLSFFRDEASQHLYCTVWVWKRSPENDIRSQRSSKSDIFTPSELNSEFDYF